MSTGAAQHTDALNHPMIVAVHDPEGQLFYAMRLIRRRALSEALDGANQ